MTHLEIREKFLEFFEERGHKIVASSSLLPTDPSVLFTTAGMQQFKPYYTGEADALKDFGSLNTVSIQKCIRTSDIDKVGDESHLTFFEMLGNFSFGYKPGEPVSPKGGYFKEEAIKLGHEFITKEMGLKIDYVSIFAGEDGIPADEESEKYWKEVDPKIKIVKAGRKDNFWGPTGDEGPCGPTSEIYVNSVEVWNLVFNQYYQKKDKTLESLKIPGIDTGMGLERLATVSQGKKNIFETDLFVPVMSLMQFDFPERIKRIIADHTRAIAFLISDGVIPSNKDQGYVLRKLMRRVMAYQFLFGSEDEINFELIFKKYCDIFGSVYLELKMNLRKILDEFEAETAKFNQTLGKGMKVLDQMDKVDSAKAFQLFSSYGLPYEIIKEVSGEKASVLTREVFDLELKKHQELSRTASAGMFKGGLADASVETTRLHTAAHLMLEALRRTLGEHVQQKGSNITSERLRFDFSHGEKMTPEQIAEVEKIVNEQIEKKLSVHFEEMTIDEAKKIGATGVFEHKYGDKVKVYFVGNDDDYFSKEICGGPHVENTGDLASVRDPEHQSKGPFRIIKEESVSAGVRRIKAILEH
ncbi:MAG: alanine--tRNA ligase [Minisyncoccia bacterium]|jgi:alanyl-tRNA synthetase